VGIQTAAAEFLICAKKEGVDFGHTLTLGRQNLFVSSIRLKSLIKKNSLWRENISNTEFEKLICKNPYYVDPLLEYLGATKISSMDFSPYEGAEIIHDLNLPVPEELHNKFDMIIDGGLLEHVFNFPVAIKNCMEMTKLGGHVCLFTPANNFFGHGFYQFSPELFYRIFNENNGFTVEKMVVTTNDIGIGNLFGLEYFPEYGGKWYEVIDPDEIKQRVLLINKMPTVLMIIAKRTENCSIFSKLPQQSDYVTEWSKTTSQSEKKNKKIKKSINNKRKAIFYWLKNIVPKPIKIHIYFHILPSVMRFINPLNYTAWIRKQSLNNRKYYKLFKK
jgi:hypothetical protein